MIRFAVATVVVLVLSGGPASAAQIGVENLQRRLWSGAMVRPLVRVTNVAEGERVRLAWVLVVDDRVVERGVSHLTGPGPREVTIPLPSVRVRMKVTLEAQLFRGKTLLACSKCPLELFPTGTLAALQEAYGDQRAGVVEAGMNGNPVWGSVPVRWKALRSAMEVKRFDGSLIFLTAHKPLSRRSALAEALLERVEGGMNLVCVGGVPAPLAGVSREADRVEAKNVRILAPEHGLLANLTEGDLANWGLDGVVARGLTSWPPGGNYVTILDLPSETEPCAVAVELRHGKGRILYCGLAVLEKLKEDPIAEIVLANLLRWGFGKSPLPRDPCRCLAQDSRVRETLSGLGVELLSETQGRADVLIADETILEEKNRGLCSDWLKAGGTILLFHLSEQGLDALNGMLRARWERDVRGEPPRLELAQADPSVVREPDLTHVHPLLAGVRREDVASLGPWEQDEKVWAVQAASDELHFTPLLGRGLVAKLERDGVRVILWQVPLKEDAGAQKRVLSALLTNLLVRMAPSE